MIVTGIGILKEVIRSSDEVDVKNKVPEVNEIDNLVHVYAEMVSPNAHFKRKI